MTKLATLAALSALATLSLSLGGLSLGCAVQTADPNDGSLPDETTAGAEEEVGTSPILEYRTEGGFVLYNADMKVYGSGRVVVTQSFVRGGAATLTYTEHLDKKQLAALEAAVPSDFAKLPGTVYRPGMIADIPTIAVSVHGKTVRWVGFGGTPVASASFQSFASKLSSTFGALSSKEFVHYQTAGGFAFHTTDFTLSNDGSCHLSEAGLRKLDKDCSVDRAALIELHTKISRRNASGYVWYQYPKSFLSHPVPDGISVAITWDGPEGKKMVESGTTAKEPTTYAAVHTALAAMVTAAEK